VNLELVRQGFAYAKSYPPDVRYDELFADAEIDARNSAFGLWSPIPAPPSPKPTAKPTQKPTPKPTSRPKSPSSCHPSYAGACLKVDASDYDCVGGSGNGPYYTGRVRVVGPDVFDLDRDGDGIGCD
jgi:Staphylococcal nuclease homologue